MPLVSRAEAARFLGVSWNSVERAIKDKRISVVSGDDGAELIDTRTVRQEWERNTQKRVGVGIQPPPKPPKPLRPREERMSRTAPPSNSATHEKIPDYNDSRARTEHLKAELLELERKQKEGLLVAAADVEARWVEIITLARTKILGIPTKAKQRIPDLDTDAIGLLEDIVRETLEDLSGAADDDGAAQ
jgi:hypothetical protein